MFLLPLFEGNEISKFPPEFRIGQRDRAVDCDWVSDTVGEKMRNCAECEGVLVRILSVAKHDLNEVSAADVMKKVGEETASEWVITQVLYDRATIGIAPCFA